VGLLPPLPPLGLLPPPVLVAPVPPLGLLPPPVPVAPVPGEPPELEPPPPLLQAAP
jgi:hypothetical protein